MKSTLSLLLILLVSSFSFAEIIAQIEAENAQLSGVYVSSSLGGYSGSGYVTGFDNVNDQITFSVNIPSSGSYQLAFGFRSPFGKKEQELVIDGVSKGKVAFASTSAFTKMSAGEFFLSAGNHKIVIKQDWGYVDLDYLEVSQAAPIDYGLVEDLINPLATPEAVNLFDRLKSIYGERILAGHTIQGSDDLEADYGKEPAVKAWDFDNYSPNYAYKWGGSGHTFGAVEDGTILQIINWMDEHQDCGFPSIQWHWHSPSGGIAGKNTFYQDFTSFDVRQAVIQGTTEYNEAIRDIDAIAAQLKKLQNAGIPILWRPLHEAHGDWFWWGSKGPEPAKKLWDIVYDRLTNHHGLNNLIWVWSAEEFAYYPGNDKLDVFGFDSYPNAFDYSPQKAMFQEMFEICDGKKLIAMSENGAIPDVDDMIEQEAMWSYFVTWDDFDKTNNTSGHVTSVFNHENVITLDEACGVTNIEEVSVQVHFSLYPNPAAEWIAPDQVEGAWEIRNTLGQRLMVGDAYPVNITLLERGTYIFRTEKGFGTFVKQ